MPRFDITPKGQQIHIAFHDPAKPNDHSASRHPCFRLESPEALLTCQQRVFEHFESKALGAPVAADKPGEVNSGKPASQQFDFRNYQEGTELTFYVQAHKVLNTQRDSLRETLQAIDWSSAFDALIVLVSICMITRPSL